jgi:CRISPR-associated endoribonuclease Cas2 subtype I-E
MPMVVIDLSKPSAKLAGLLARRLIEVRSNLFVGMLSKRAIEVLWELVQTSRPQAALLVFPAKNENGIAMRSIGQHRFQIEANYGLQLISRGANVCKLDGDPQVTDFDGD